MIWCKNHSLLKQLKKRLTRIGVEPERICPLSHRFPRLKISTSLSFKCWLFGVLCKCPNSKLFMFQQNYQFVLLIIRLASCNYYFLFSLVILLQSCLSVINLSSLSSWITGTLFVFSCCLCPRSFAFQCALDSTLATSCANLSPSRRIFV